MEGRLVNWEERKSSAWTSWMQRTKTVHTLRMWVKTLNPSWSDPSPCHSLRALKVPTLTLHWGGPPLTGFPPPPFGQLWKKQSKLAHCKVHLPVPYSGWTRSLNERTPQTSDKTDILDLEEHCNLKMYIMLASQRHAQNTEGWNNAHRRSAPETLARHARKRQCLS